MATLNVDDEALLAMESGRPPQPPIEVALSSRTKKSRPAAASLTLPGIATKDAMSAQSDPATHVATAASAASAAVSTTWHWLA